MFGSVSGEFLDALIEAILSLCPSGRRDDILFREDVEVYLQDQLATMLWMGLDDVEDFDPAFIGYMGMWDDVEIPQLGTVL